MCDLDEPVQEALSSIAALAGTHTASLTAVRDKVSTRRAMAASAAQLGRRQLVS